MFYPCMTDPGSVKDHLGNWTPPASEQDGVNVVQGTDTGHLQLTDDLQE